MLLKTVFWLCHLFWKVEFELIQLISQHPKIVREMLLDFQNKTNIETIQF